MALYGKFVTSDVKSDIDGLYNKSSIEDTFVFKKPNVVYSLFSELKYKVGVVVLHTASFTNLNARILTDPIFDHPMLERKYEFISPLLIDLLS